MAWAAGAQSSTPERLSAAEFEREMDRTRADLTVTLAALRPQLAPRRLVERGSDMVDATLRKVKNELSAAARQHVRWVGLLGLATAGLGWFLVAQGRRRSLAAPRPDLESLLRPEREPPGWLVGPLPAGADRNRDTGVRQTGGDAPTAGAGPDIAPAVIDAAPDQDSGANEPGWSGETRGGCPGVVALDMAVPQPLVIGVLALAAAAVVAMLLPRSRAAENNEPSLRLRRATSSPLH